MRSDRIALALALSLGCAGTPPAPAEPPSPAYSCSTRADGCGDRLLVGMASGAIADPLPENPAARSESAYTVRMLRAIDDAFSNELRTNGGSAVTETEYYSLYRRYLLAGADRPFVLAAIAASHRPLAEAFEQGACWHWFMDHGGREDGKLARTTAAGATVAK
jgi:hypothetical protein